MRGAGGDEGAEGFWPLCGGGGEVLDGLLPVGFAGVHAAEGGLVFEDEVADDLAAVDFEGVAVGDAGEDVAAIVAENIEKIEVEGGDAGGLEDEVDLAKLGGDGGGFGGAAIDVGAADLLKNFCAGRVGRGDAEAEELEAAQLEGDGGEEADGAEAGDEGFFGFKLGDVAPVGESSPLDFEDFVDRFFDDRHGLAEDAILAEFWRDFDEVIRLIDDKLGLEAVAPFDAPLEVVAGVADVGALVLAGDAFAAAAADGDDGQVSLLEGVHFFSDFHDFAEHLVAEDDLLFAGRGIDSGARDLFAVGAADAHLEDFEFHLVGALNLRVGDLFEGERFRLGI